MSSGADAVVGQSDKHTGPIRALDFNPFQVNLPSDLLRTNVCLPECSI